MHSIAVVTNSPTNTLGIFLKRNIEIVTAGFVEIRNYYLAEIPPDHRITEDVVLVMTKEKAVDIKNRVDDAKKIIVVHRTIQKSEIYSICSIPPNTKVLVVNDNAETTLEMVSLLYKLGIDHLELVPFDPKRDYPDIKIAITPAERIYVPQHIGSVIDTGHRNIDISTFIQIIDMLALAESEVNRRLFKYSENIIPLESGISSQYRQLYLKNLELDSIVNLSHEGVLLVDNEGKVNLHNRAFSTMMETVSDIVGKRLADIIDAPLFSALMQDQVDNELVSYRSHSFIVTRKLMEQYGEKSGSYFNFRDVTHIRQLEQTLNKKLQTRGFLPKYSFGDILTASPVMRKCVDLARKFAHSDLPVLISGESGTGKELLAHSMHVASKRSNQPFVAFNCAAVPESLIESELFGYEAGSFTGALKGGKTGLFEQANNGTVFLDEIGDMPYILQSKLLRVLQEMQVMRVGSQNIIAINIRVIAATNQDLEKKINQGQFRKDLFYRLNVLPLPVPPLRERTEDIAFLFRNFLKIGAGRDAGIAKEAEAALLRYRWPGNIRELWNVASYASFFDDAEISIEALPEYLVRSIDDFSIECDELSRSGLIEAAMEILKAIAQQTVANGGAGRASLRSLLESREIILSEGIIRRIMAVLNARNLIESGVGRNGSKISAKGASFINWYLNR